MNLAELAGFKAPEGQILGWKVTKADRTTYDGFQWPLFGPVVSGVGAPTPGRSGGPEPGPWCSQFTYGSACPSRRGDGLCVAKTLQGAGSSGLRAHYGLALAYAREDVLGENADKLRVSKCVVLGVFDVWATLRAPFCAASKINLSWANLRGANLHGADLHEGYLHEVQLHGADLSGTDLHEADLRFADLRFADLRFADLRWANLREANLREANLRGADLRKATLVADLRGADLRGADLRGADLRAADLRGADLRAADLRGTDLRWANTRNAKGIL